MFAGKLQCGGCQAGVSVFAGNVVDAKQESACLPANLVFAGKPQCGGCQSLSRCPKRPRRPGLQWNLW